MAVGLIVVLAVVAVLAVAAWPVTVMLSKRRPRGRRPAA
jgi:Tfp pilus assembly protein PilE